MGSEEDFCLCARHFGVELCFMVPKGKAAGKVKKERSSVPAKMKELVDFLKTDDCNNRVD